MKQLLPFVLLFSTLNLWAQHKPALKHKTVSQSSWFAMNAGLGIPLGDLADDDVKNPDAGLAKVGVVGKIDLGIKIYNGLGICLSGIGGQNKLDESAFDEIVPSYPGVLRSVNLGTWNYLGGMGGLYMLTPIGRGAFMIRGQMGIVSASSPSIDLLLSSGSQYARAETKSAKTTAPIFELGCTGIIPLYDYANINIGLSYLGMSPKFTNVSYSNTSSSSPPKNVTYDYKMEMKWVALSVGFCWAL